MIERQTIDGRPASVQYLTGDMHPASSDDADIVHVMFDDGESIWLTPKGDKAKADTAEGEAVQRAWDKEAHPRGQALNAGQFVTAGRVLTKGSELRETPSVEGWEKSVMRLTARSDALSDGNVFDSLQQQIDRLDAHLSWLEGRARTDAEFKESDHPRDEDGKFTSGGGTPSRPSKPVAHARKIGASGKPYALIEKPDGTWHVLVQEKNYAGHVKGGMSQKWVFVTHPKWRQKGAGQESYHLTREEAEELFNRRTQGGKGWKPTDARADAAWNEADHPRGHPKNAGMFAKGGGGTAKGSEEKGETATAKQAKPQEKGEKPSSSTKSTKGNEPGEPEEIDYSKPGVTAAPTSGGQGIRGTVAQMAHKFTEEDFHILKNGLHHANSEVRKGWGAKISSIAKTLPQLLKSHLKEEKHNAIHAVSALKALATGGRPTPEQWKGLRGLGIRVSLSAASMLATGEPTGSVFALAHAFGGEIVQHVLAEHAIKFGAGATRFATSRPLHMPRIAALSASGRYDANDEEMSKEDIELLQEFLEEIARAAAEMDISDEKAQELLSNRGQDQNESEVGEQEDEPEVSRDDEFREADHPRGQPENAGQFIEKGEAPASSEEPETKPAKAVEPAQAPAAKGKAAPRRGKKRPGTEFVSPSIEEHLDFPEAIKALKSKRQALLAQASKEIDVGLGLKGRSAPALGAWSDGAENSIMVAYEDSTMEKLRLSSAMKASLADQKATLVFQEGEGDARLFSFEATGDLDKIHADLLTDGLEFHTIVPTEKGARVYVADLEGNLGEAVAKGAERYGSEVRGQQGTAEFIGTTKQDGSDREQRDDAQERYHRIIEGSGDKDAIALWKRLHDTHWGALRVGPGDPLPGSKGHPSLISSRRLGSKSAIEGDRYRRADLKGMQEDPRVFKKNMELLRDSNAYPNLKESETKDKTPEQIAKAAIAHAKSNLLFLYNSAPQELRESAHQWYEGAHEIAAEKAKQYGLPLQSAVGIYAALSPTKMWDMNVYLGDRIIDIYHTKQNFAWNDKMSETAKRIWKPKDQKVIDAISGKKLSELTSPAEKAVWIRTYDEAHSDMHFDRLSPSGERLGLYYHKDGETPWKVTWQSIPSAANAIMALESGGDRDILSVAMGARHKVRSFYNNILDPHSANLDVTMDTHAIGAALLRSLGSNTSAAVLHSMASSPTSEETKPPGWQASASSDVTGSSGTYGLWADAYREAAAELNIEPRVLQSIAWEVKRRLFDDPPKRVVEAVEKTWQDYHDGKLTIEKAQAAIWKLGGGVDKVPLGASKAERDEFNARRRSAGATDEKVRRGDNAGELHRSRVWPGSARVDIGDGSGTPRGTPDQNQGRLILELRSDVRIDRGGAGGTPDSPASIRGAGLMLRYSGDDGERVLFVQHKERGTWEFPGGVVEDGESAEAAALREVGEEVGATPYGAVQLLMRNTLSGVDYSTFIANASAMFSPNLEHGDGELVDWMWAAPNEPPEPLHPGVRVALERMRMDELDVAKSIASGQFSSPQQYKNMWLFAMRVTGTGVSFRPVYDEYVWRPPELYLTSRFLERIQGLPVIWVHPPKETLDTREYGRTVIGSIYIPFIDGDEVWCISRINDGDAADWMRHNVVSTSPGVAFDDPNVNEIRQMHDGKHMLIEGNPSLVDHLAVCEAGVWDKGGRPTGVPIGEPEMAEPEEGMDEALADMQEAEPALRVDTAMTDADELASIIDMIDRAVGQLEASL